MSLKALENQEVRREGRTWFKAEVNGEPHPIRAWTCWWTVRTSSINLQTLKFTDH